MNGIGLLKKPRHGRLSHLLSVTDAYHRI